MTTSLSGSFDNTGLPLHGRRTRYVRWITMTKRRARACIKRSTSIGYPYGAPHLRFAIGESHYTYCYVRKNACSAFKNFLLHTFCEPIVGEPAIRTLTRSLGADTPDAVPLTDTTILVLRDPIDRCCSVFRNKLIQRNGAIAIGKNIRQLTDQPADEISFEDFVLRYLCANLRPRSARGVVDVHCIPQADYLWPIQYNCAISINQVNKFTNTAFGPEIHDRFFAKPVNSSRAKGLDDDAARVPAATLAEIYASDRRLPTDEELVNERLRTALREIYAVDFELVARGLGDRDRRADDHVDAPPPVIRSHA